MIGAFIIWSFVFAIASISTGIDLFDLLECLKERIIDGEIIRDLLIDISLIIISIVGLCG